MASRGRLKIAPTRAQQARRLETRTSALRLKLTEHLSRGEFSASSREGRDYREGSRTLTGPETRDLLDIVWELANCLAGLAGREPERIGSKDASAGNECSVCGNDESALRGECRGCGSRKPLN